MFIVRDVTNVHCLFSLPCLFTVLSLHVMNGRLLFIVFNIDF